MISESIVGGEKNLRGFLVDFKLGGVGWIWGFLNRSLEGDLCLEAKLPSKVCSSEKETQK